MAFHNLCIQSDAQLQTLQLCLSHAHSPIRNSAIVDLQAGSQLSGAPPLLSSAAD